MVKMSLTLSNVEQPMHEFEEHSEPEEKSDPMHSMFEKALIEFEKSLRPEEKQNFKSTSFEDVKAAIINIQQDQENTRTLRNLRKIEPFIMAMEAFSKVIEVYLNASQFVCYVWGPLKFFLQVRCVLLFSAPKIYRPLSHLRYCILHRSTYVTWPKFPTCGKSITTFIAVKESMKTADEGSWAI